LQAKTLGLLLTFVARATHDRGEDGTGSIVTSETSLAHTGAIINHQSLNFTPCFLSASEEFCQASFRHYKLIL
jgi:hypothetical protein